MADEHFEETFTIRDLETLKVISDPLRVQVLDRVTLENNRGELCTVKQVAEYLETPPHKLYYHFNLLEKHGLLRVADTRVVSGIIEKRYQATARQVIVDQELFRTGLTGDDRLRAALSLYDSMASAGRSDLLSVFGEGQEPPTDLQIDRRRGHLSRVLARMSVDQINDFHGRLSALVDEFENTVPEPKAKTYVFSLTLALLPSLRDPEDNLEINLEEVDDHPSL